jgi:hypothetical protein
MFAICRAISLSRGTQSSFPHIIIRTMWAGNCPPGGIRAETGANRPATIAALGSHHANKLVRVLPTQFLELWSGFGGTGVLHPLEWLDTAPNRTNRKHSNFLEAAFQCLSAALTVVEGHVGVRWHGFGRLTSAIRTVPPRPGSSFRFSEPTASR